ncbi:MAG TPA: [protein-PII] uridylyltransferase [Mycobacteriales bacterium]|nr:[protein-PII] uridylyltransferase [Mycobacteriales bacterium]
MAEVRAGVLDQTGLVGPALRAALTTQTDAWLAEALAGTADVALIALGSYGRAELAPGSDLDLLLLHRGRSDIDAVAERLWYPIWDSGVGLDHSVRTVEQAVSVARSDLKAALGLLDNRCVAGDPELATALHDAVFAAWRRDARQRLPELIASVRGHTERCGELAFLLEPDLKDSHGGIRDLVALRAFAAAWVVEAPDEALRTAYSLLLDVRGELHRRSTSAGGRSVAGQDRLVLQEQEPVAAALGLADADELMRRVSTAARVIGFATDEACRRAEASVRPPRRLLRRGPTRRPLADGVVEADGEVVLARDVDPATDPVLLLRAAAAAAQAGLPVAGPTVKRLTECPPLPEPWPADARDALVSLLGAGSAAVPVIEALDQAGLLVRLIPEWEAVRCKPQRNAVHQFTVDRHLVEAAAQAAALTRQVARPDLLLLGALLHDIGKGFPGDHTDAGVEVVPRIARRLGLPDDDVAVLVTLVRHHLLLPDTATRRDLDDPATVQLVAAAVGDVATLELLHALTEADALATGPAAWGDWKAGLVADLVRRTASALASDGADGRTPPSAGPGSQMAASPGPNPKAPTTVPPPSDYPDTQRTAADRSLLDDSLRGLAGRGELGVSLDGSRLTVVAPDRPGLLWRWAGVAALHRLQIRAATASSLPADNGVTMAATVLDVAPRFGAMPDLAALQADVHRAYADALPLAARLAERERAYAGVSTAAAPPRVLWADGASTSATVVEVRAHDSIGLLYRLTHALAEAGLDVRSAKISTLGSEVVDAFYLLDADGEMVDDPERREQIEAALLAACAPSPTAPSEL